MMLAALLSLIAHELLVGAAGDPIAAFGFALMR